MQYTKKYLFLVLFLFSLGTIAFAQTSISLGLKGGLNYASGSLTEIPFKAEVSPRTVFGIGGVVVVGLYDFLHIQAEPRYIQKGGEIKATFGTQTIKATLKLDYFEIPVSLLAKFDAGMVEPYVFAGPTISLRNSAKHEFEDIVTGKVVTDDFKDETEDTEFSLDFGAGLSYCIAPKISLTGDIRYSLGLSKVNKPSNVNDKSIWKSRDVKFLVGVLFSL